MIALSADYARLGIKKHPPIRDQQGYAVIVCKNWCPVIRRKRIDSVFHLPFHSIAFFKSSTEPVAKILSGGVGLDTSEG